MSESAFVGHEPCPECGSSDALSRYDDGHGFCFACEHFVAGEGGQPKQLKKGNVRRVSAGMITDIEYIPLRSRNISRDACVKFGYGVSTYGGKNVQVAPYYNAEGQVVAQKVRFPNKDFIILGDLAEAGLFGSQLWGSGKKIVITEGEIDALSVCQAQGLKWPTVSVPNGAKGARKALARNIEYLRQFDEVILMFDMDEPGREAAAECVSLFRPGQCKVASLPLKDPSELVQAGRGADIVSSIWNARPYRPEGIVTPASIREEVLKPLERGLSWWHEGLDEVTYGRHMSELATLGAGTGIGKTDFITQQVAHDLNVLQEKVGVFFLEQPCTETNKRVAGKMAEKTFHVPDGSWTLAELETAQDNLEASPGLFMYDNFGATDWDAIASRIEFLHETEGVRLFYVDHLSALADPDNETATISVIMREAASLAKALNVWILMVSHLSTPDGTPHEEGGRVSIRHFKGSRTIGFWSHFMIGLERDQQADDPDAAQTTLLRVLKERYTGRATGKTFHLGYDSPTGILYGRPPPEEFPDFYDETTRGESGAEF